MDIYDIFVETALKGHVAIPDEGQPTWYAGPSRTGQSRDRGGDPGGPRGDDAAGVPSACQGRDVSC